MQLREELEQVQLKLPGRSWPAQIGKRRFEEQQEQKEDDEEEVFAQSGAVTDLVHFRVGEPLPLLPGSERNQGMHCEINRETILVLILR